MKAIISRTPGGPETLSLEEVPEPIPAAGQVLLAVRAVGVNYPDFLIIEDRYQFKPQRPFSPGAEVSGVVEAVGAGVVGFFCRDRDPSSETTLLSRTLVEHRGDLERVVGRDLVDRMIEHAREGWLPTIPGSPNAPQAAWSRRVRGGWRARISKLLRVSPA